MLALTLPLNQGEFLRSTRHGYRKLVVLQVCRNGRINRPIWYSALRYVTCSSGVNLNRKSFCWLWMVPALFALLPGCGRALGRARLFFRSCHHMAMGTVLRSRNGAAFALEAQTHQR